MEWSLVNGYPGNLFLISFSNNLPFVVYSSYFTPQAEIGQEKKSNENQIR